MTTCQYCPNEARPDLTLGGKPICGVCAHTASHCWPLQENQIPTPMVDDKGEVIPFGVWPNIDYT